jgi:transposase
VIGAYHQLWRIEHAFRMSKHDLRARPVYHHKRESIDAHLAVVFAALAISCPRTTSYVVLRTT